MSLHLIVLHYIMPYSSSLFMCLSPALPLPPFFFLFLEISLFGRIFLFLLCLLIFFSTSELFWHFSCSKIIPGPDRTYIIYYLQIPLSPPLFFKHKKRKKKNLLICLPATSMGNDSLYAFDRMLVKVNNPRANFDRVFYLYKDHDSHVPPTSIFF